MPDFSLPLFKSIAITIGALLAVQISYFLIRQVINTSVSRIKSTSKFPKLVHKQRLETLASLLKNITKFTLWGIAFTTILSSWNINIAPLLAGAGIVGLAIGFGAQTLVRDIMMGLFMLGENYINVGDQVEIAGKKGRVVSVKLRTTIVKDDESGQTHIVPNSAISVITKFS